MSQTTTERRKKWYFLRSMFRAFWEHLDKRRSQSLAKAMPRPLFAEALEPRVLFSAAPAPVEQDQEVEEVPVAQEVPMEDGGSSGSMFAPDQPAVSPGTTTVTLNSGNLEITDSDGGDTNDDLVLRVDGTDFLITDTGSSIDERVSISSVTGDIVINGSGGDDTFTIDLNGGPITKNIVYNGGEGGFDTLRIIGTGGEVVTYNHDTLTYGNGVIDLGNGHTITFTGLEPVDVVGVATFSLTLTGANDIIDISNGLTGGGDAALVLSGTSGGVAFELANVRNVGNVVINTTAVDGSDTITITSANNAHGNGALSIITGNTGADSVTLAGDASFSGDVLIQTGTLDLTGGVLTAANATFRSQANATVGVGGGAGTFNLTDAELTTHLNVSGKVTIGGTNSGEVRIDTLDVTAAGYDLEVVTGGSIFFNTNQTLQAAGTVTISANQDNAGGNRIHMFDGSSITTTDTSANAVIVNVGTTTSAEGPTQIRSITTGNGGGVTLNFLGTGSMELMPGTTISAPGAGSVTINSEGTTTLSGTIDAGSGLIDINANNDGSGAEGLIVNESAVLTTTNSSIGGPDAIDLRVNLVGGGTGAMTLGGSFTTGAGGGITASTYTGLVAFGGTIFVNNTTMNPGAGGKITITADEELFINAGKTVSVTAADEIEFNANADNAGAERFFMFTGAAVAAGATGADSIDINVGTSNGSSQVESLTTAAGGTISIQFDGSGSLNLTGGTLTASGADQIEILSQNGLSIANTVDAGSGKIIVTANNDGAGAGSLSLSGTLTTTNTAADAIAVSSGDSGGLGPDGNLVIGGTLQTGAGGGIVIESGDNISINNTTLDVGASGTFVASAKDEIAINSGEVFNVTTGSVTFNANDDAAGSDRFLMFLNSAISGNASSLVINVGTSSGTSEIRSLSAATDVDIELNLDGTGTLAQTGGTIAATGTGNVFFRSSGGVDLGGTISIADGVLDVDANNDGSGSAALFVTESAVISTANAGASAIDLRLNTAGGGTGNITLGGSLTTGAGGTITVDNSTSALGAVGFNVNNVTLDTGAGGTTNLIASDELFIQTNKTLSVTGGSLVANANNDANGTHRFFMFSGASISSTSSDADAVSINVGTSAGTSEFRNISVGNGGGISIDSEATLNRFHGGTALTATSGAIDLALQNIDLLGSLSASGGTVTIGRSTAGTIGVYGATAFGDMRISQTELNNITAATLNIGDPSTGDNNTTLVQVNGVDTTAGISGTTRFNALESAGSDVQFLGVNSFNVVEANANNLVDLQGTTSVTTQTGGASFNADADGSGAGTFQTGAGSSVNTATPGALITVTAADVAINGTSSLNAGTGGILLRPVSDSSTIGIGGGTGSFALSDGELATLVSSGTVTIGRAGTGAGSVDIDAVNLGAGNFDLAVHGGSIAVEGLDLADQDVSLTALTGSITDGGGTTDITANAVSLNAANGSIGGAGAAAIDLQAASLGTDTSTGGGSQFLNEVDNVDITSALGGTGTLTINGGEFNVTTGSLGDATNVVVQSGATLDANGATDVLGSITVQSGGSLKGDGTLSAPVTIESGGTLAPGQSPGLLATGDLVVDGSYVVETDGPAGAGAVNGHDQTVVTGSVTLNSGTSTLTVDVSDVTGGEFTGGTDLVIISNDGVDAVTGVFSNFGEASIVHSNFDGNLDMVLTYQGGDGNDVALRIGNLTTRVFVDGSGNLVIEDINDATNDQLTIQVVGSDLVISEADGGILIDAQGALDGTGGDLTNQVTVALSSFTGNVIVRAGDGNDTIAFQNMDLTGTQGITVEDGAGTDTVTFSGAASNLANGTINVVAQTITVNSAVDAGTVGNITLNASGGNLLVNADLSTGGAGTIDLDATGAITQANGSAISSGSGTVTLDATGNITIAAVSTTGLVAVTSGAAILDGGDAAIDVTAGSFSAVAATGIGAANGLETAISNLEASSGTGNLRISNTGALTIGGVTGALGGLSASNRDIEVRSTGDLTIDEAIAAGGGDITLTTDGIAINAALSSSTGVLTIAPLTASTSIGIGGGTGTLNLDDSELAKLTNGFGDIVIGSTTAGTGAVDIDSSLFQDRLTIAGGSISVTELGSGSGTVTLTARTGAITEGGNAGADINAGTLNLNAAGDIGASGSGNQIVLNASTLRTNSTLGGNNGNQYFSEEAAVNIAANLNAGTGTATLTESGTFRLTNNAIADATTLVVQNGASLNLQGATDTLAAVIVNDGGVVYGLGTLNAAVTVNDGGIITPGTTIGGTGPRLIATGSLTLESGSLYQVELDGTAGPGVDGGNDQLNVTGTVTINDATLQLAVLPALYNSTAGETFVIINNDGGEAVSGTFFGLPEGSYISVPTGTNLPDEIFQISYVGGTGNDVVLIATGETATTNVRIDGSGNLVIDDILGATTADNLSISRSGGNFIIEDLGGNVLGTLIVGASQTTLSRISVPESLVTGGVIINTLAGDDAITIGDLGTLDGALTVNGGTGTDSIAQSTNATVTLTGTGAVSYTAERITMLAGSGLGTDSGDITLLGNSAGTAAGNFKGITVIGADITSASGDITLTGQGGNSGTNNYGIYVGPDLVAGTSSITTGGTGTITISGTGRGTAASAGQIGVLLTGTAVEATGSGAVAISGRGGSSLKIADGLIIEKGSTIEVNTGNLSLTGTGGTGGSGARGVVLTNSTVQSNGGSNLLITGTAGNAASSGGVEIGDVDISTTGSGTLTIRGTSSGGGLKGGSPGVLVAAASVLETVNGELRIEGTGNGALGAANDGVQVLSKSAIRTTGTGNLNLLGTGGTATSSAGITVNDSTLSVSQGNLGLTGTGRASSAGRGVELERNATLTSSGAGNITILGTGSATATLASNSGVYGNSASISLTGSGALLIRGTAGAGTTLNEGVALSQTTVSTVSGNIEIHGTGRGNRGEGSGVVFDGGTSVSAGTTGNLTVRGTGSVSGLNVTKNNRGVEVSGGASLAVFDGDLSVTGTGGGNGQGKANHAIDIASGMVRATGGGDVTLSGTAGFNGTGIRAVGSSTIQTSSGGLSLTGFGGGGVKGNYGIYITLSNVTSTGGGGVNLLGRANASTTGTLNIGVWIDRTTFGSVGTVSIVGTGGGGTGANHGIYMNNITQVGAAFMTAGTKGGGGAKSLNQAGNFFP